MFIERFEIEIVTFVVLKIALSSMVSATIVMFHSTICMNKKRSILSFKLLMHNKGTISNFDIDENLFIEEKIFYVIPLF